MSARAIELRLASPHGTDRWAPGTVGFKGLDTLGAWYTAGPQTMRRFDGEGPLLTDDQPAAEYHRSFPGGSATVDRSSLRGNLSEVIRD